MFIVIEGIDGSGKTTQIARLAKRIKATGRSVVTLAEPTREGAGAEIRDRAVNGPPMTAHEELDLFLDDRRRNVGENIRPALATGHVVLQDRYYFSTAAYQTTRPELGMTVEQVLDLHAGWAPVPDVVVLLDMDVDQAAQRIQGRGAITSFENIERQRTVRENFFYLAAIDDGEVFRLIPAIQDEAVVEHEVWLAVQGLFGK